MYCVNASIAAAFTYIAHLSPAFFSGSSEILCLIDFYTGLPHYSVPATWL